MQASVPRVTVLMAVHNGEHFLRPAIESILNQTYRDFELLIVDDASTDNTPRVIQNYTDPRIKIIHNAKNLGAGIARDIGLQNALGEYVAVLDADDVAYPERLEVQSSFLDSHRDIALVGSACEVIDERGIRLGIRYSVVHHLALRWSLLFRNPIVHSTVMYRRSLARQVGGYEFRNAEDFALWSKLASRYPLEQIPKVLAKYRTYPHQRMCTELDANRTYTHLIIRENIKSLLGRDIGTNVVACLNGGSASRSVLEEGYMVLCDCLTALINTEAATRKDRKIIFKALLSDLLRIAHQNEKHRFFAIWAAVRCAICYTPESLISPECVRFILQVALPASMRKMAHQWKYLKKRPAFSGLDPII